MNFGPMPVRWAFQGDGARVGGAAVLGIVASSAESLIPIAIGYGLQAALEGSRSAVLTVGAVVALLIAVRIISSVARFRVVGGLKIDITYRVTQVLGRHVSHTSLEVARAVGPGEVATALTVDASAIGSLPQAMAEFAGAIGAYVVVGAYLLSRSALLGILVLCGVPLMVWILGRLQQPLEARQTAHRELLGSLAVTGGDLAKGLRVLRGVGGETVARRRYRATSEQVRQTGVRVASTYALLDACQVLVPGAFLVAVIWFGAHLSMSGTLAPGELVALYGCSVYLVQPISAMAGMVSAWSEAAVGAVRVARILNVSTSIVSKDDQLTVVPDDGPRPELTVITPDAWLHSLDSLRVNIDTRQAVTNESVPYLFAGSMRDVLDPRSIHADAEISIAVRNAVADDVLAGLEGGLDAEVDEGGSNLSGGQRQRIGLARIILFDPEVLILIDPTSALDAVTEIMVAESIRNFRRGRITIVVSDSAAFAAVADKRVLS